jgi:hypothetical protein
VMASAPLVAATSSWTGDSPEGSSVRATRDRRLARAAFSAPSRGLPSAGPRSTAAALRSERARSASMPNEPAWSFE